MFRSKRRTVAAVLIEPSAGGWEVHSNTPGEVCVQLFGRLNLVSGAQNIEGLREHLGSHTRMVSFDASALVDWDNVLVGFLSKLERLAEDANIAVDRSGLPGGAVRLVALARTVPERLAWIIREVPRIAV